MRKWPRTDLGTVLLHWLAVVSIATLVVTGLRFTSDDIDHVWLRAFDHQLASENLWYRHMMTGYVLTVIAVGYAVYMVQGGLVDRIRLNAARLQGLFGTRRMRWSCINVLLYWAFLLATVGACVTGWLAYHGAPQPVAEMHLLCTWVIVAFPILHLFALLRLGGLPQILRIFRPKRIEGVAQDVDLAGVVSELLAEKHAARLAIVGKPKSDPRS